MTKAEEILKETMSNLVPFIPNHDTEEWVAKRDALTAMHTYAAGFAEWKDRHYAKDEVEYQNTGMLQYYNIENEDRNHDSPTIYYTTTDLLKIYDGEK